MDIEKHQVDLWFAQDRTIRTMQLLGQYRSFLSCDEMERCSGFYFDKHRHQFLVARALVRCVLSQYERQVPPQAWRFVRNSYGKPYIDNPEVSRVIHFNLSHTDGWIVLAVTLDNEVGVDVERIDRSKGILDLADRYFSPIESEELRALPPSDRVDRFFDLWTLKESYIKACGKGLTIPLHMFTYRFPRNTSIDISFAPEFDDRSDGWRFWQFQPDAEHKVAVAVKDHLSSEYNIRCRRITPLREIDELSLVAYRKRAF
jgi:4'-phosphopantetheinyl transferase